ncbi:MAG: hypothetical protein Q8O92_12070 [Candidatus Latescibacter sp.]|nr:hypothetical protein [Candidatus Latescibacter sp.]
MCVAVSGGKDSFSLLHPNLWRAARLWWEAYGDHPLHKEKAV